MKQKAVIWGTLLLSAWLVPPAAAGGMVVPGVNFLAIPSSGFTAQTSEGGYGGDATGNARLFAGSALMFAPVNLPHGARASSLKCGGLAPVTDLRLMFTLRRNSPQVANINMITAATSFAGIEFESTFSNVVAEPEIDNEHFNYYIVAEVDNQVGADICPTCMVNSCRIVYIDPYIFSDGFETGE